MYSMGVRQAIYNLYKDKPGYEVRAAATAAAALLPRCRRASIALVAAQKGDKDKALAKLGEAIDRKLPNPDKVAEDALFAPLADDARFKDLVAKAAKK